MFAVDFAHASYNKRSFFAEAKRCYTTLQGDSAISTIKATRHTLQVIAITRGQWPHSSFPGPGGIASTPDSSALRKCSMIPNEESCWYERQILGGPPQEWEQ